MSSIAIVKELIMGAIMDSALRVNVPDHVLDALVDMAEGLRTPKEVMNVSWDQLIVNKFWLCDMHIQDELLSRIV